MNVKKILVEGAKIVNASGIFEAELLIEGNRISRIGKNLSVADECLKIDARGKHVFAGFIDLHAHLRTPGREDEEDFVSGAQAAVKGGFTKIFCMPNTEPAIDNEAAAAWVREESARVGLADIYPVGAVTKKRQGKELTEFAALKRAGCLSLSDDGASIRNTFVLRKALEAAKTEGILIVSHCEDTDLSARGAMRECLISSKYGVPAIAAIAESLFVQRNIEIAKYTGARLHLAHISTAGSLDLIRAAKQAGVRVTCETCPHYFIFTVEDIEKNHFDSNFKVNPPLGEAGDIAAVKNALKEGVIDCIATDHAPHSVAEKEMPFEEAPFGLIGLETAFAAGYTYLVKNKIMDLTVLAEKMSFGPARILGLEQCGIIEEGMDADIVIVDLEKKWVVSKDGLKSKSKNTPFLGMELEGVIDYTINKGKIVYSQF